MEIDVSKLLALPAADRLELAEILTRSVGYPGDIEVLRQPAWRRESIRHLLEVYADDAGQGLDRGGRGGRGGRG